LSVVTASATPQARDPRIVDGLLALGLTALSLGPVLAGASDIGSLHPASVALLLIQTLPLAVRRLVPVPVFVVTTVATVAHALLATDNLSSSLGSLIALYTVADRCDRRTSVAAWIALGIALASVVAYQAGFTTALGSIVQTQVAIFVAWLLGIWSQERRTYVGTVEERAARAEQERAIEAERAVFEERSRIARELHDVVSHHVSVIVIQAGAARRALDRRPEDAATAIEAIDASGRQALTEMRRMLGILGPTAALDADGEPLEPMPGLDRLGDLLASVRAAGLPVELAVTGERPPLDPGLELSAYRIIQEALTNTMKHAHGARARVTIAYAPTMLDIEVTDEGGTGTTTLAGNAGGRGLVGMRERVAMFGGTFEAAPRPGGYRVRARLPIAAASGSGTGPSPSQAPA
ncbi:MAG TPA: histidine kinase, partial [Candidatus Limnocylindrales bacterium]